MVEYFPTKGERTMSRGFIAQYAAEAARQTPGVADMDRSSVVMLKEALGLEHEGYGVTVAFHEGDQRLVTVTVYPIVYYGHSVPELAWMLQENVKADVETYTGLVVEAVHVHVKDVVLPPELEVQSPGEERERA